MMKQFYPCGLYQYQLTLVGTHLQPKMVWSPCIATWRVYRLLRPDITVMVDWALKNNNQSINCFKQSHSDPWHCGKNTTALS